MNYDAIIVGGGPAGSAAAITLSNAGVRVLVADKSSFPRDKPCGDGLFPDAVRTVESFGVDLSSAPRISKVETLSIDRRDRAGFELRGSYPGAVVPREYLDLELVKAAERAGSRINELTTVESLIVEDGSVAGIRMRSPGGVLHTASAPVTVLAEGSIGTLRKQAPIPRVAFTQTCFAARRYWHGVELDARDQRFEMHFPLEAEGVPIVGYGWVFPVGDEIANVGVGYFSRPANAPGLTTLLAQFERLLVKSDRRFRHAERSGRAVGAPIRIGGSARSSYGNGILAIGDAAGVANPFTGEGISQALRTGIFAAKTIIGHLDRSEPLSDYAASLLRWNRSFDRLSNKLPVSHKTTAHLARDIIPMFGRSSSVARSVLRMLESKVQSREQGSHHSASKVIECLAGRATERSIELATRERPFFTDLVRELLALPDAPASLAIAYYAVRTAVDGEARMNVRDHRIATVLELVRVATFSVDSLNVNQLSSSTNSRGGDWAESYFTLGLADRVLARAFSQISMMSAWDRSQVSSHIASVFRALTVSATASGNSPGPSRNQLLANAAVRVAFAVSSRQGDELASVSKAASEYLEGRLSTDTFYLQVQRGLTP